MNEKYSDVHRFLLRTVASHGVITISNTKLILQQFTGQVHEENSDIEDLVTEINYKIRQFRQTIAIINKEETEDISGTLVFLSTGDDDVKIQNMFSKEEQEYFRNILDKILVSDSQKINNIDAINCSKRLNKREELLVKWCQIHYLKEIKEGNDKFYTLGLRSIYEFELYIPDKIKNCNICKENMFSVSYATCSICNKDFSIKCIKDNEKLFRSSNSTTCKHNFVGFDLNSDSFMDSAGEFSGDVEPLPKRRRISKRV